MCIVAPLSPLKPHCVSLTGYSGACSNNQFGPHLSQALLHPWRSLYLRRTYQNVVKSSSAARDKIPRIHQTHLQRQCHVFLTTTIWVGLENLLRTWVLFKFSLLRVDIDSSLAISAGHMTRSRSNLIPHESSSAEYEQN